MLHTSTCWQIWISLAIWFSSSLFLFTRLVRLFSRVCCWKGEGGRTRPKGRGGRTGTRKQDQTLAYIAVLLLIITSWHHITKYKVKVLVLYITSTTIVQLQHKENIRCVILNKWSPLGYDLHTVLRLPSPFPYQWYIIHHGLSCFIATEIHEKQFLHKCITAVVR